MGYLRIIEQFKLIEKKKLYPVLHVLFCVLIIMASAVIVLAWLKERSQKSNTYVEENDFSLSTTGWCATLVVFRWLWSSWLDIYLILLHHQCLRYLIYGCIYTMQQLSDALITTERCINWAVETNYVLVPTQIDQWKQRSLGLETGVKLLSIEQPIYTEPLATNHSSCSITKRLFFKLTWNWCKKMIEMMMNPFMTTSRQCSKYIMITSNQRHWERWGVSFPWVFSTSTSVLHCTPTERREVISSSGIFT